MANITYFDAMNGQYSWADDGSVSGWEEGQYRQGWATIGDTKPSVEQFNTTHQLIDQKANWLYAQLKHEADNQSVSVTESMVDLVTQMLDARDDAKWPVGSIYANAIDSTNPGVFLPGTWAKMTEGVLYPHGAPDAGGAGHTQGETRHKLTVNELPKFTPKVTVNSAGNHSHTGSTASAGNHNHSYSNRNSKSERIYSERNPGRNIPVVGSNGSYNTSTDGNHKHSFTTNSAGNHTHSATADQIGGGSAHNNMPPAVTVYMWKRTA